MSRLSLFIVGFALIFTGLPLTATTAAPGPAEGNCQLVRGFKVLQQLRPRVLSFTVRGK